jgi:cytochrome c oxidase subunit 2
MSRLSFVWLALLVALTVPAVTAAEPVAAPAPAVAAAPATGVDRDVALFNPNIYSLDEHQKPVFRNKSPFVEPGSDVARRVVSMTWFSALIFLPFLVLPLVLLLVVIFRFRDHGDGRKPATFTGNHKLEVVWTLIPCLALTVVCFPTWTVLDWMEAPPIGKKDQMTVTVVGKQFAWDYTYKGIYRDPTAADKEEIAIGQDQGIQEPLILVKGRTVSLNITSDDVNHAWWIPAFGVKKDAIKGRFTYVWFTPDTLGIYKGQCAELCGANHGLMIVTASVVEEADFDRYISLRRHRGDTLKVWNAIQPGPGAAVDEKALRAAVAAYLAKGKDPARVYALSYWIASNFAMVQRVAPPKGSSIAQVVGIAKPVGATRHDIELEIAAAIRAKRDQVERLLKELVAVAPADPVSVPAVQAIAQQGPGAAP